jgi:hypothetical protein
MQTAVVKCSTQFGHYKGPLIKLLSMVIENSNFRRLATVGKSILVTILEGREVSKKYRQHEDNQAESHSTHTSKEVLGTSEV